MVKTNKGEFRILIAISGCDPYERTDLQQPMRETWLADAKELGFDYRFFHGRGSATKSDIILVDCNDEYFDLTSKTKLKCKWAVENGYDFVFCCFPDTYACAERLATCGFEDYDYFGDLLYHANGDYCQGGQGYWLSRRAAKIVAAHESNYPNEDCYVGDRMRENEAMRRGDSRYFLWSGYAPASGPLKNNNVVACHLSQDTPNGYEGKYMHLKHDLWLASNSRSDPHRVVAQEVLQEPLIALNTRPQNPGAPRRVLRGGQI